MIPQDDLIESFAQGYRSGEASNMFIDGDAIYSYGYRFILAIRRCDFLINGDTYSPTTTQHTMKCICGLRPNVQIPFSALEQVFRDNTLYLRDDFINNAHRIVVVDTQGDKYREVRYLNPKTGERETRQEHLLGATLFEFDGKYFLSSTDSGAIWGRGYFLVELPGKPCTVDNAFESLLPNYVRKYPDAPYIRQGEFFFVPDLKKKVAEGEYSKQVDLSEAFGNGGNPHYARDFYRQKRTIWVRGTVRHPEHRMCKLGEVWHKVYINRAVKSYNSAGGVD